MKQISKKTKITLLILGLLLLVAVGATIAYYNSQKMFRNEFSLKAPGVAIHELFNPADQWVPEEEKKKEIWFTNTGKQDMLLRFKITAEWEDGEAVDGYKAEDVITYGWNGGDLPADFQIVEADDGTAYYYYKKILKAGQPTDKILKSVKFTPYISNDGHEGDFSDKQINVTLTGETILVLQEAANEEWGVSYTEAKKADEVTLDWQTYANSAAGE